MRTMIVDRKSNRQEFVGYLRVFAMLLIVLCHLSSESTNGIILKMAQFFNVGVEIFFLISGYLFGLKIISGEYKKWYWKRAKRIFPSYYLFLMILFLIYLIKGMEVDVIHWIIQLINLQGSEIYVHGAEHLWFLTVLMFCYIITPILDLLRQKISPKQGVLLFGGCVLAQVIMTYFVYQQLGIYMLKINIFIFAYICGANHTKLSNMKHKMLTGCILGSVGVCGRLLGRFLVDESVLYNVMIVGITQSMLAVALLLLFMQLFRQKKLGKGLTFLDNVSYEIYLVHYMFIVGPVSLMGSTGNFVLDAGIVIVVSVAAASGVHFVSGNLGKIGSINHISKK